MQIHVCEMLSKKQHTRKLCFRLEQLGSKGFLLVQAAFEQFANRSGVLLCSLHSEISAYKRVESYYFNEKIYQTSSF